MMRPLWLEVTRMEHIYCRLAIGDLKTEDGKLVLSVAPPCFVLRSKAWGREFLVLSWRRLLPPASCCRKTAAGVAMTIFNRFFDSFDNAQDGCARNDK